MLNSTEDRIECFICGTVGGHRSFLRLQCLPNLPQIPKKIYYFYVMTASDMSIRISLRTSLRVRGIHVRVSKGADNKQKHQNVQNYASLQ